MLWCALILARLLVSNCDKLILDESGQSSIGWTTNSQNLEDANVHLHVEHLGESLDVDFRKVANAYKDDAVVKVMKGGRVESYMARDMEVLTFESVDRDNNANAVLSIIGTREELKWDGVLMTKKGVLHIEADTMLNVTNEGNVLGACNTGEEDGERRLVDKWTNCYTGDSTTKVFSIGVAIGSGIFARRLNSNHVTATQWVNTVVSDANIIYQNQLNIVLTVAELVIQADSVGAPSWDDPNCQLGGISQQLSQFRKWEQPGAQGLWHLFDDCYGTSGNTIGLATMLAGTDPKGVLCMEKVGWGYNEFWNTAVSWYGGSTWKTFAHEIGHNFGASHSFEDGQGSTGGIMDYGSGLLNGEYQFNTQYRKSQICGSIQKVIGTCSFFSEYVTTTATTATTTSGTTSTTTTALCNNLENHISPYYWMTFNQVTYTECGPLIAAASNWCSTYDKYGQGTYDMCAKTCCHGGSPNSGGVCSGSEDHISPYRTMTFNGIQYNNCDDLIAGVPFNGGWCVGYESTYDMCARTCCISTTPIVATSTTIFISTSTTMKISTSSTTTRTTTVIATTSTTATTMVPTTTSTSTSTSSTTTLTTTVIATTSTTLTTMVPTTTSTSSSTSTSSTTTRTTTVIATTSTTVTTMVPTTTSTSTSTSSTTTRSTTVIATTSSSSLTTVVPTTTSPSTSTSSTTTQSTTAIATTSTNLITMVPTSTITSTSATKSSTSSTTTRTTTAVATTSTTLTRMVSTTTSTSRILATSSTTSSTSKVTTTSIATTSNVPTTTSTSTNPITTTVASSSKGTTTLVPTTSRTSTISTTTGTTSSKVTTSTSTGETTATTTTAVVVASTSTTSTTTPQETTLELIGTSRTTTSSSSRFLVATTTTSTTLPLVTTASLTEQVVKLLGSFIFYIPGVLLGEKEALVAIRITLLLILGVDEWQLRITISRARRLAQSAENDWDIDYEVLVPPQEAQLVQSSTEAISQDSTSFGESLKQQLVAVGVNQTNLENFTMGKFTATEIVTSTSLGANPSRFDKLEEEERNASEEGSSYIAAIVGGTCGGFLVLVAFCLRYRYRRPREVLVEEEIDVVESKALQSKVQISSPQDLQVQEESEEPWSNGDNFGNDVDIPGEFEPGTPLEPLPQSPRELQIETFEV